MQTRIKCCTIGLGRRRTPLRPKLGSPQYWASPPLGVAVRTSRGLHASGLGDNEGEPHPQPEHEPVILCGAPGVITPGRGGVTSIREVDPWICSGHSCWNRWKRGRWTSGSRTHQSSCNGCSCCSLGGVKVIVVGKPGKLDLTAQHWVT